MTIVQKLEDSELRYRRLFEASQDGLLILDAETGMIKDVNPFLIKILGYSREELVEKKLWEIGAVKDIKASQIAFEALQQNEYIHYEDLPLKTKNGRLIQVEFVSNVYQVGADKVIQCNIRDITSRRNIENEARKANSDLQALVTELQRRDKELKLVNHMDDLLQSCTTVIEAYQVVSIIASDLFSGKSGALAILQTHSQYLETVAQWGDSSIMKSAFSLTDCWAMRRGQLHEVLDPAKDLLCQHFTQQLECGTICMPLMVQGETLGLLSLVGNLLDEQAGRQQQLLVTVAEAIKLSLSNIKLREELREQAISDPLTGLYNRRYLEESLTRELYHAQRLNADLCVALMDLDHFKQINDTFGHGAGDIVLREVARILRENLRSTDILCRYGGDEFLLVLPDSSLEDNYQRLDQIRKIIKKLPIRYGENLLEPTSISFGIAAAQEHAFIARDLIRAADTALYAAKQPGNDQIVITSLPKNLPKASHLPQVVEK